MKRMPTFTAFVAELGLTLTRGQTVLCRVAFDGVDPGDLKGEDRELARAMFGDVEVVPALARRTLSLTLGRGSGKTTIASAYGVWRMVTADVSKSGPGDVPHVVTIAPTTRTAKLAVGMGRELVAWSPALRSCVESETAESFTLRRPDRRRVAFAAFPASRGGAAARGLSVLSLILDEAQFFASGGEYVVSDKDVFGAIVPRLMAGGAAVFISTPWPVPTLMGELDERNFGAPKTALAARAPTLVMRDNDPQLAALVSSERDRDPENAAREFDVDASLTAGSSQFFSADAIKAAIDETLVVPGPEDGATVSFGADLAFASDSSTICGVTEETDEDPAEVVELEELRPAKGAPLRPSRVVGQFAEIIVRRGSTGFHADGHYKETAKEHCEEFQLEFRDLPGGQNGKLEQYLNARKLLHEGRLLLPNHGRLLAQLRAVVSKPGPKGGTIITSPRRTGMGHGDLVSALVAACWAAKEGELAPWHRAMNIVRATRGGEDFSSPARQKRLTAHREKERLEPGRNQVVRAIFSSETEFRHGDFLGVARWKAGDRAPTFSDDAEEGLKFCARSYFKRTYFGGVAA